MLGDGDGRADSGSKGGGAVNGDASGEASDKDDELPETASSFRFRGDGVSLEAWLGEALKMSVLLVLSLVCFVLSRLPCSPWSRMISFCDWDSRIFAIQLSLPSKELQNVALQDIGTHEKPRVEKPNILRCRAYIQKLKMQDWSDLQMMSLESRV